MVEIKNLSFSYSRKKEPVFRDLTLNIGHGGVYGLLGRNGVGKTTLMYLIAGALTPSAGTVTLDGTITRRRLPSTMSRLRIVTEESILPPQKLSEYVKLNSYYYPDFSQDLFAHICDEFELTPDMRLDRLSTGAKKKVALAFAFACNTPLLLLDEPTNGLDIPSKDTFRRILAECMSDDRTIVVATHQVHDLERLLSNVIILDERGLIINRSISEITEVLRFDVSNDPKVISSALWSQPGPGGTEVVTRRLNPDDETEVDLEMLFKCMSQRPETISL
ncbi:MAG: ATP-binding cassette domain-containing protein [Bacteroides sp.]|nr:ATP-binding cassette domain-containing protein [Bacteroides sp.]